MPRPVLERARQLLSELAVHHAANGRALKQRRKDDASQMQLFSDPGKEMLRLLGGVNVDSLTPIQAFELLRAWKEKYGA